MTRKILYIHVRQVGVVLEGYFISGNRLFYLWFLQSRCLRGFRMRKFIKYGVVPAVIFLFLLFATVVVLPLIIGIQQFHPEIEKQLTEFVGRPVTVGSNVGLSFFPWLSISCSNFKIANPDGFVSEYFVKIDNFEARLKLLPLLKRKMELNRFIVGGLKINLERRADGQENWLIPKETSKGDIQVVADSSLKGWTIPEDFAIDLVAVTNGRILWNDQFRHSRHTLSNLMFLLHHVTRNSLIGAELKASIDGKSLSAEGEVGPLGQDLQMGELPVDLAIGFLQSITGQVKGKFTDLRKNPGYNLKIHLSPFSVKDFLASLDVTLPAFTDDFTNFATASLDINAWGDGKKLSINKGKIEIDDMPASISLAVKDFDHPELEFALDIDRLDIDRYLSTQKKPTEQHDSIVRERGGDDYGLFRKINSMGTIRLKELKVAGGVVRDINANLRERDGVYDIDSSSILYQGHAQASLNIDSQRNPPQSRIDLKVQDVEIKPLLHDFWKKDFLSGLADADLHFFFSGFSPDAIVAGLYANGSILCKDGDLNGIDLLNAKGKMEYESSGPNPASPDSHTEFSELKGTFIIRQDLFDSQNVSLQTADAEVMMSVSADLASRQWKLMSGPTKFTGRKKHDKAGSGKIIIRPLQEKDSRF